MDREKILLYSEKKENLGKPEHFLGAGEVKEPGCGDCLEMFIDTKREVITEFHYTVTDTACPPLKACAARVAECALGKPVMEAYLGGLEKESIHCAQMAEIGLKRTLQDYAVKRAERISKQA